MRDGWADVRLGEVVEQVKRRIKVESNSEYRLLGVRWYGSGPFHRETVTSVTSKAATLYQVAEGDFIYNRLFAWKGSFGTIGADLDGHYVSGEFPLFRCDSHRLDPRYLNLVMTRPEVWAQIERESTGSTATSRNRWKEERFLDWELALPSLVVQRRVVDLVDAVDKHAYTASQLTGASSQLFSAVAASLDELIEQFVELGDIADVVSGVTKDSKRQQDPSYVEVPYLRVANVQRAGLDLADVVTIRVPTDKARSLRLEPRDVLFNEGGDRDKLGRGWVWEGQIDDCIHQNHVLRARITDERFDPYFVAGWANGPFGQRWFELNGTQTTNLASLNLSTLRRFPIPVVDAGSQAATGEALRQLKAFAEASGNDEAAVRRLRSRLLDSLLSGQHEIPDSYDDLVGLVA